MFSNEMTICLLKLDWSLIIYYWCLLCQSTTIVMLRWSYGPPCEKTCLWGNNTGADQPAHPNSLISVFVIRFLESIISRLATSQISIFWLVSLAELAGLNLTLSETPKTGFVAWRPIYLMLYLGRVIPNKINKPKVIRHLNLFKSWGRGHSFVCFDALHPIQQFFSHVETFSRLPGLNQY